MTKFSAVHQILPTLVHGDAIGNQVLFLQSVLRSQGLVSEIFAGNWDAHLNGQCQHFTDYKAISHADNLLILHFSIGSEVNKLVEQLPDHKLMIYHNITPGHFFYGVNDHLAHLCDEARQGLPSYAKKFSTIADSPYNALELKNLGVEVLEIVPPLSDASRLNLLLDNADAKRVRHLFGKQDTQDWLFVGRHAPNKCVEDVIKAFYFYHTWIEPKSRLLLIGNGNGMEPYVDSLYALVTQLDLDGAVIFGGYQPDGGLAAFYEMADLYISMSEHEGFCVPLVEAMHFGLPIMAYNSTNVPYTLGDAGVLFNTKNHSVIAEMAHEILTNVSLKAAIINSQNKRVPEFSEEKIRMTFLRVLDKLCGR